MSEHDAVSVMTVSGFGPPSRAWMVSRMNSESRSVPGTTTPAEPHHLVVDHVQPRCALVPQAEVYVVEFHPLLNSLGPKPAPGEGPELLLRHDYLGGSGPVHRDATHTYTDGPAVEGATDSYEWMHGLGEVVNALIGAGLDIRRLRESPELPWPRWPHMVRGSSGWWRLPEPGIPLLYGLLASR